MIPSLVISGRDRAFTSWLSMMRRCFVAFDSSHENYGGRGITVCERWFDWRNFLADMGDRPEGMSLDRIDNEGHYEPGNCRWTTATVQNRNSRKNTTVELDGVEMLASDAAEVLGVAKSTIGRRVKACAPLAHRQPLKLTESQAQQIKKRLSGGETCTAIAADFAVTRQHVAQIRDGKCWRNV